MLTPSGVTLEDYNNAIAQEYETHARVTFVVDNIVFQDGELEQGGISLSTYMNPDTNMKFGIAYSTEASIHIFRSSKTDEVNFAHEFTLEFGVEINGSIEWVKVGHFTGVKPVQDINANVIELTAYDKMIRFDRKMSEFVPLLTFPCTISDIFNEMCEFVVVENISGDEIADVMNKTVANEDELSDFQTVRELLAAIAEANGCYAKITSDGKLQLVWFHDHTSDMTFTLDNCFGGTIIKLEKTYSKKWGFIEHNRWKDVESVKYSEYDNASNPFEFSNIQVVWNEYNDLNKTVIQPPYDPYYRNKLWANVENYQWEFVESMKYKELEYADDIAGSLYTIMENPFLYYTTDAEIRTHLQHILDKLYIIHLYYVASVNMVGNWLIEPGDIVMLEIMPGVFTQYPIFNRILRWNGSCECDYETTGSLTG